MRRMILDYRRGEYSIMYGFPLLERILVHDKLVQRLGYVPDSSPIFGARCLYRKRGHQRARYKAWRFSRRGGAPSAPQIAPETSSRLLRDCSGTVLVMGCPAANLVHT